MKVKRMVLDVDKTAEAPTLFEIAEAIQKVPGVEGANLTVNDIDMETIGLIITIEGDGFDHKKVMASIEETGAVVHSVDELVVGEKLVNLVERKR